MSFKVTHVVRRFGPVGGMERYVFELVKALSSRGIDVTVICEDIYVELPSINFVLVEKPTEQRPRYKAMQYFRNKVEALIDPYSEEKWGIIHSHERLVSHHVTTFHGPPIGKPQWWQLLKICSKRIRTWLELEKDELGLGENSCQFVLPVSTKIRDQLLDQYPEVAKKLYLVAWPGVNSKVKLVLERNRLKPLMIGFVGVEWKRKGLPLAVQIVKSIRNEFSADARLLVCGPDKEDVPRCILNNEWVTFVGWAKEPPYEELSLLLLPALKEPYGMVVAEARAKGVPVICSKQVGAAFHGFEGVMAIDLNQNAQCWARETMAFLSRPVFPEILQTWDSLATDVLRVYEQVGISHD